MRFSSTPESAAEGEITFLAIVETLLAIALSLLLLKVSGSSAHIVAGALIAPFLLLRTEASTVNAFSIFDSHFPRLAELVPVLQSLHQRLPPALRSFTFIFVGLPLFSLFMLVIKSAATVATLIASPRETLLAIPENWLRATLAVDSRHLPEFLPGIETAMEAPASVQSVKYAEVRRHITSGTVGSRFQKLGVFAIYASAVLYRLFLKSTSLIYFPLIWVIDAPTTANGILRMPLERARRWYACAVLLIMLSPFVISFHVPETLANPQDRAILKYVLPVDRTDWWNITRMLAVAVTIGLYFYVRTLDRDGPQHQGSVELTITYSNRIRAACGIVIIAYFILIVLVL